VWCFLPNHFHFLLSEDSKPGLEKGEQKIKPGLESKEISMFMHRIQLAYAMYYSLKYKDTIKQGKKAPVFEGNFKAKEITDENYLAQVAYYIRHNAVKHGIVDDVRNWAWAGSMSTEEFPVQEYTGIDAEFDPGFE
jgi:REP element-mobilizing transposase RayT